MSDIRRDHTSASGASRDAACPGAHRLQQGIPEPPSSDEANSGKRIHLALKNSGNIALLSSLTTKEREIFDACRAIEKAVVLNWFGPDHPPMKVYREERIWVKFYGPDKSIYEHSGEPDVIYHSGAKALIADYKTGIGEVEDSSSNLQLRDLVCLFRGDQMRQGQVIVECATVVIQPLVTQDPVVCSYKEPDIDRAAKEMMDRVIQSNSPNAQRFPGNHCRYCRGALTNKCLEHQRWSSATLPTFRGIMEIAVDQWTPEQRQIFCERHQMAKEWLQNTWEALCQGAATDPNFIPGWGLGNPTVQQPITDIPELVNRIVAHGGTPAGLLAEAGKITKEKLETYFKKLIRTKIKGSVAQNKAYEDLLKGITTPKPNKPTLKKI